jgi:hypothetical protein
MSAKKIGLMWRIKMDNNQVIEWLLGDDNPAVKYRTQTEILGQSADRNAAMQWIFVKLPANWHETKGLWYTYYVTALAECGLKADDIDASHIQRAFLILRRMSSTAVARVLCFCMRLRS